MLARFSCQMYFSNSVMFTCFSCLKFLMWFLSGNPKFKNINNKKQSWSVNFDVENFYQSILETLLIDAINFTKSSANITKQDLSIIMQSRKTLLFQNSEPWVKKLEKWTFRRTYGLLRWCRIMWASWFIHLK